MTETYLSRKDGYTFYFQQGDDQIACFSSCITGRELVYVNDELVSSSLNWGFTSAHDFKHNMTNYRVTFRLKNPLNMKVECSLADEQKTVSVQTKLLFSIGEKPALGLLLKCFIIGFAVGGVGYFLSKLLFAWS
jgi:hypothetical protein